MNRSNYAFNTSESQIQGSSTLSQKYKLVFLGDQSVGKTSIINRFIFDTFDGKDHPTVGIDFISKTLWYDDKGVKLQLWDTAGQERFRSLIPSYIRDCTVAILVYDITSENSFNNLSKWIEDVRAERGNDVILVIVGNKVDLVEKRAITKETAENFSKEHETLYMEVSAKIGDNVNNLFYSIAAILPGNEANRNFHTEQNVPGSAGNNFNGGGNIQLENNFNEGDEFKTKNNCSC
jgi:Ras-related protein Rab-6A